MKVWQCSICKYIHRGDKPPEKCPVCGAPASKFVEIEETSLSQKTPPKKTMPQSRPAAESSKKQSTPLAVVKQTRGEKIISLLIKHHAHPVSVHTPNGILPAAVVLWIAAWIFDYDLLARAAFINLIFVIIALPFVIFTGFLEWKKKYNGALTILFKIKILAATLTAVSCTINFVWYLMAPEILSSPKAWVFLIMNIIMLMAAGIAGHIGGKLVFKD